MQKDNYVKKNFGFHVSSIFYGCVIDELGLVS